ncbi:MAG: hypothetical protein ACREBU_20755 [Nitrososphaera sp.]
MDSAKLSVMDLGKLAEILFFSAGITREVRYDSGTFYMRAASVSNIKDLLIADQY